MNFHEGPRFQRGRGIGSMFGTLFRSLMPVAKMGLNLGKRFITSDVAKQIGSTALDIGKQGLKNVAIDLLEGKDPKLSAQEALDNAKQNIANTLRGGNSCGKKRRKRANNNRSKSLKYNLLDEDEF